MNFKLILLDVILLALVSFSHLWREAIRTRVIREIPFMCSTFIGVLFMMVGRNHNEFWFAVTSFSIVILIQIYYFVFVNKEESLEKQYQIDVVDCHPFNTPIPISYEEWKKQLYDMEKK